MQQELAYRRSADLDVWLLWDDDADRVTVRVRDNRGGEEFESEVPRERALEAFRHPFVFAPPVPAAA
jgi:hypothetical protein